MNARRTVLVSGLMAVVLLVAACSAAAPSAPQVMRDAAPAEQPAAAPPPSGGGEASAGQDKTVGQSGFPDVAVSPYGANRMIIKNGEMNLMVLDTDRALDQVTGIAVDNGGYIVNSKTWTQDGFKYASITMGVPSDQFEATQRRLRAIAVTVLSDTSSGQDVSEEYVDLQSRLTNLEATEARTREFLSQAKNVDEALQVNAKLTEIEGEIEQVKGRMQYLKDRSAYSTIAVNLEPQRPTPTPSPTPTPVAWQPAETFKNATDTLGNLLRQLGDVVIWLVVVVVPFAVVVLALAMIFRRGRRGPGVVGRAEAPSEVKRDE